MNPHVDETKLKCATDTVFEEKAETILQPIARGQNMYSVHELLQKCAIKVWLPNLKPNFPLSNISIPKHKQMVQPSKMCSKVKNTLCLKNHFETIS